MIIQKFIGNYYFLSNFYSCAITYQNYVYPSAEHLFQALKTNNKNMRETIRLASSPTKAKQLGQRVMLKHDWENIKNRIMYRTLRLKFTQNRFIQALLIQTKDAVLEENNMWHDQYWGNCYCTKHINIQGKNYLGKLLMKLRKNLSKKKKEKKHVRYST